jgi:hypothetical protein
MTVNPNLASSRLKTNPPQALRATPLQKGNPILQPDGHSPLETGARRAGYVASTLRGVKHVGQLGLVSNFEFTSEERESTLVVPLSPCSSYP